MLLGIIRCPNLRARFNRQYWYRFTSLQREAPRLCRGGSSSLTFPGVHRDTPRREPPSTRKGEVPMDEYQRLSHTKWDCKYHVVFIPKCRRKVLYGELRQHLGAILRTLAEQKDCRIDEGHLMPDHVHMLISVPPKYAVSQVIGYVKGKSAVQVARTFL